MTPGKAKKIGEINVPANAAKEVSKYTLDVASSVDNLKAKHAIFLVAEYVSGIQGGGRSQA